MFSILIFNQLYLFRLMTLNRVKLGCAVTFMKYLSSLVFLMFLPLSNKIMFWMSNSLNLAELAVNELTISISEKNYK